MFIHFETTGMKRMDGQMDTMPWHRLQWALVAKRTEGKKNTRFDSV